MSYHFENAKSVAVSSTGKIGGQRHGTQGRVDRGGAQAADCSWHSEAHAQCSPCWSVGALVPERARARVDGSESKKDDDEMDAHGGGVAS